MEIKITSTTLKRIFAAAIIYMSLLALAKLNEMSFLEGMKSSLVQGLIFGIIIECFHLYSKDKEESKKHPKK